MTVAAAAPERFDIGRVFAGGFAMVARRPLTFIIIAALFAYLPTAATLWLTTNWLPPPTPGVLDFAVTFRRLAIAELIAVAFGGPSPEHDVSSLTGLQAARELHQSGRPVLATGRFSSDSRIP